MPACAFHLLSLAPSINPQTFVQTLATTSIQPLTVARVVRWIILPTTNSTSSLLAQNIHWDILLVLPSVFPLPPLIQQLVQHQWTIRAGIPRNIIQRLKEQNKRLLNPEKGDVPPLTGALQKPRVAQSTQALEMNTELRKWVERFGKQEGAGAVSMLNLLAFKPGKKQDYLKYGAEFAGSIGSSRGGNAKIVGTVIHFEGEGGEEDDDKCWDEVALAHYPTIYHFADMLASDDYQEVNQKYRVGSLEDTFILCTTELEMYNLMKSNGSKL